MNQNNPTASPLSQDHHISTLSVNPYRPLPRGKLLVLTLALAQFPLIASSLAQNDTSSISPSLSAATERALVRSQENLDEARTLMNQALIKRSQHNLEGAYQDAVNALALSPSGSAIAKVRQILVADYTKISLDYARELIANGKYQDAETAAKSVLDPSVNPSNKEAVKLLSDLQQPEVFNKTVTPKSAAQHEQVVKLLRDANGLFQSGRYDLAMKQYDAVLLIDPYNTAARKGMEEIHQATSQYADEAYNETRSRMLWQVEKTWERPPHKAKPGRSTESVGRQEDLRGTDQIVAKLNSIIIPKIDLSDSPISEAVAYLKQKSVEQDPAKKGVNIFLKLSDQGTPVATPAQPTVGGTVPDPSAQPTAEPKVTLALNHVPLYVALDYLSKLSNMKLKIDPYAVSIVPLSEPTDILVQREYKVPPTFIPAKSLAATGGLPQAGAGTDTNNISRVAPRQNAQDYLSSLGIDFPAGASANYLPSGSKLVVRNTRDNIDQIDALVDAAMSGSPSQVDITTKFVEINQNNIQELGFDWLLGPFSIGGGVYGSGGGAPSNAVTGFPFNTTGMNPVGALRSGSGTQASQAISANSIGSLLAGNTAGPAPGIFSIAGIFNDPQFQLVIRALNQKKGVDLMAAPKVTTKSGQKATVKIVQEFIYPTTFTPPTIPTSTGSSGGSIIFNSFGSVLSSPPTVTPSFPDGWKTQNLGVTLEAKPTIASDGFTIDLELHPEVVDFDGFINYGSPINAVGQKRDIYSGLAVISPFSETLTENVINQPVFSVRDVTTVVTVTDGQTVALGGLIREDVQKVQDKIPVLGDIPMAGRLFRTDVDQKLKKNLVIFVTPTILDAEGHPRHEDTEEPEIVTPLGLPQDLPQPTISSTAVGTK